jgi:NADH-quinone oxidoreductase subunit N
MDALIVVFVTGLITMFIAMAKKPVLVLVTALTGLSTAIALLAVQLNHPYNLVKYEGLEFDGISIVYSMLALIFGLLIIAGGYDYFKREPEHTGEYISLILFSLVGAMCMIGFTDLFMFFLGLEIMSIPIYVLAGSKKKDILSTEASVKYFFTGAFATGILLFGIAWLYGATGSFQIAEIANAIGDGRASGSMLSVGILLIMASFLFKVGAAPFHFWSPDVYAGSPNIVTGFMAAVVKLAGMFAFMKMFAFVFGEASQIWVSAIYVLAMVTMFVGNLSALRQTKFKRILAYSSISNAGYALLSLLVVKGDFLSHIKNIEYLWFYLMGYGFAVIALIVISLTITNESDDLEGFRGVGRKNPVVGVIAALGLLSLAGVPPLAGFFGKYMVFSHAFKQYPELVIVAILNSGIGIYYYLKMLMTFLASDHTEETQTPRPTVLQYCVLIACAIGLIAGPFVFI